MTSFYTGAAVSKEFMHRWRSAQHIGAARPWCRVQVRRGRFERRWHNDWPNPQFGQVVGHSIRHQWYADWTPLENWVDLPGVQGIDLDQSFDKNGLTVATLDVENVAWVETAGAGGQYHKRQRGYLWPWRGWVPPRRPGSGDTKNEWYRRLPNAQILVQQGYGSDTAVKTFTGLIDSFPTKVRPDHLTLTARDFGGVLTDCDIFGWNKTKNIPDPITFIPHDHKFIKLAKGDGKTHRWIIVKDSVDIVKCVLRWAGFKEWQIDASGVDLATPYTVDKSHTYMDVINAVKEQLGYVFLMGEPSADDLSIGVPIFRPASVTNSQRSKPIVIRDKDLLTDMQPQHTNTNDRYIIRVRGAVNNKIGRTLGGDTFKRVTFTYWPPWMPRMAGVIKQLTYYNIGSQGVLGYRTQQQCTVACVLIAIQIALGRDTATLQTPGQPALGLDSFAFVTDAGTGIASRLYITNRKSKMTLGGDGTSQQHSPYGSSGSSQSELLWATEVGGSLCDNGEFEHLYNDYQKAIHGKKVLSWGTPV
jgi:hypothetical protein